MPPNRSPEDREEDENKLSIRKDRFFPGFSLSCANVLENNEENET